MRTDHLCPDCARPIRTPDVRRSDQMCPHCGAPLERDDLKRWINVARLTNLAEAGFLADELSGEGIDARVYQTDDFSAATDRWRVSYLIQSRPHDAKTAAARIRRYMAEMEPYSDTSQNAWDESRTAGDPLAWRPVALVILAGMASFALGQRFAADRQPPRPQRNTLSGAVSEIGRPLVTEPVAGLPRHRLYYHWREDAWYLDSDADADGRYESRRRFHSAGAAW